jgi:hypothetical protein
VSRTNPANYSSYTDDGLANGVRHLSCAVMGENEGIKTTPIFGSIYWHAPVLDLFVGPKSSTVQGRSSKNLAD